jgi:hypothetical protein
VGVSREARQPGRNENPQAEACATETGIAFAIYGALERRIYADVVRNPAS